jgi:LEA14-like dessication related protein
MNKGLYYIIGAGAIYFAYKYFGKAKAAKTLNVKIKTLNLSNLNKAAVVLEIINPTNAEISINSIVADLKINDYALSTLSFNGTKLIRGNSSIDLELMIKINPFETALYLANILKTKDVKPNTVSITGAINGEGLTMPFNLMQNLK